MSDILFTCTKFNGTGKRGILKPDAQGYYTQPIGGLNAINSRGEYYELKQAEDLFRNRSGSFMRRVQRGALRGEVGHPRFVPGMKEDEFLARLLDIDEKNVCVFFKDIWLEEGHRNPDGSPMVAIMARLKPSGAKGEFLQQQLDDPDQNVCFSIRSFTENSYRGGRVSKILRQVITFDYVNEPGIALAEKFNSPAIESLSDLSGDFRVTPGMVQRVFEEQKQIALVTGNESFLAYSKEEMYASFGWNKNQRASVFDWH